MKSPFDSGFAATGGDEMANHLTSLLTDESKSKRMAGRLLATGLLEKIFDWSQEESERKGFDPLDHIAATTHVATALICGIVLQHLDLEKLRRAGAGAALARDLAETVRMGVEGKLLASLGAGASGAEGANNSGIKERERKRND